MKVVIGSESFAPNISGVAIFAENLAHFLAGRGHEVWVIIPSRNTKTAQDMSYKHLTVVRLGSMPNPFRRGFRITTFPRSKIKRVLQDIRPDIIHLQDPTSICSALLSFGNKNNIPVVITNHFSMEFILSYLNLLKPLHPHIERILAWHFSRFYNRCSLVTTPSSTAKNKILKWGITTPIAVLSNGINKKRFCPTNSVQDARKALGFPQKPVVLYTGRIDKDKSLPVLISAIPEVIKHVDAHFAFIGSGDQLEEMRAFAGSIGVGNYVSFTGPLNYNSDEFPLAYQAASLFATASTIETQSIVMLEALASGLPVVAANAGSLPEFVQDGVNGRLFAPGDHLECARAITTILQNDELRQKMGKKSLEVVK
ncbi:MAG: Alpha-monoglucosyldiacylglycerol synthase [bacterium ADurb.Bin400]|nr:MAG: Alpha-monoglucosyldiacylglycerol synthase [bacterium ADurb.Bin400]